jgi:hypothetical protein
VYSDDLQAARARIEALESEVRRLKECQSKWHFQPHPEVQACPDCGGTNYFRPQLEKLSWWRRLLGRRGTVIQAGGNVNIRTGSGGKIKGIACPELPPEPPPPKLIPPPGGSGVQPPPPRELNPLLEAKLDLILDRLQLLEVRTQRLTQG